MTLSELLKPELILTKADYASKDELISELVVRIYNTEPEIPFSSEDLLHTIQMREQIGGTILPSGLSVPHARLKNFEGFILALGLPAKPVFHDGFQIKMMSLMITSQSGGLYYLPTLAVLTKISRDNDFFSLLCGAEKAEDFIRLIREKDQELG
jgi:PTS system nitrogen regulatory IIA component